MEKIPVVYTTDENYAMPTCVAIVSMLEKADERTFYNIYIVLTSRVLNDYKQMFERVKERYSGFELNYLLLDNALFKNSQIRNSYLTFAAYYRLYIAELLPKCDKCIYMDSDVIVEGDLKELFSVDMDGFYVAGVKDMYTQLADTNGEHRRLLGIPAIEDYIYSGVMVLNLEMLRKSRMMDRFNDGIARKNRFEDQDVINTYCYGKIKHLPVKFNLLNRFLDATQLLSREVYCEEELEMANSPVIIHFPGWIGKPWNNLRHKGGKVWWRYAERIFTEAEYKDLYSRALNLTKEIDWTNYCEICRRNAPVVLFGFSDISKGVLDDLLTAEIKSVVCFCDNDEKKQQQVYKGVPVLSLKEILKIYPKAFYINTSQVYFNQINRQLGNEGVPNKNILVYFHKDRRYYMELAKEYYEHELKQIILREFCGETKLFMSYLKRSNSEEKVREIVNRYWMDHWLMLNDTSYFSAI